MSKNKNQIDKFKLTYGIEIEGGFSPSLAVAIEDKGTFKFDGSVDLEDNEPFELASEYSMIKYKRKNLSSNSKKKLVLVHPTPTPVALTNNEILLRGRSNCYRAYLLTELYAFPVTSVDTRPLNMRPTSPPDPSDVRVEWTPESNCCCESCNEYYTENDRDQYEVDLDDASEQVYEEFASDILESKQALFDLLDNFNKDNFYSNDSCGVHLHISVNRDKNITHFLASDYKFVCALQSESGIFDCCKVMRQRRNINYCKNYDNREELSKAFASHDKYRTVRFHPQGTLEFRLLGYCEHLKDNINKIDELVRNRVSELSSVFLSRKLIAKKTLRVSSKKVKNIKLNYEMRCAISQ